MASGRGKQAVMISNTKILPDLPPRQLAVQSSHLRLQCQPQLHHPLPPESPGCRSATQILSLPALRCTLLLFFSH